MLRYLIKEYKVNKLIGKFFEAENVNLIYGESGVGKTKTTVVLLNNEGIEPILIDYDNNLSPEQNQCKYRHIDGYAMNKEDNLKLPINDVIIIDTYAMYIANGGTHSFLKELASLGNTVIVVAHNKNIATKKDIPDVDETWSNHLGSKIWMYRKKSISYIQVLKSRGYVGERELIAF